MIRVLIADDSQVFQRIIVSCIEQEPGIEIVGIVDNGEDAVEKCRTLKPDLVTMDIFMPGITGLEATRRIMKECPTRIVIISSMISSKNIKHTFEAMKAGAVEVIDKPQDMLKSNYSNVQQQLVKIIKRIMEAQPTKRLTWLSEGMETPAPKAPRVKPAPVDIDAERDTLVDKTLDWEWEARDIEEKFIPSVIAIGGSTGAPAVIADILTHLPEQFYVPILIAQHIVRGFAKGMSEWLNAGVGMEVKLAEHNAVVKHGQVLFAPDDMHLGITNGMRVKLKKRVPGDLYVPSVNHLFSAVSKSFGPQALGIILSGMGKDGAQGLLDMRKAGAVTISQNEATSVVWGMPKVANDMGAVMNQMDPAEIVRFLSGIDAKIKKQS